jgi:hypothetical protein
MLAMQRRLILRVLHHLKYVILEMCLGSGSGKGFNCHGANGAVVDRMLSPSRWLE